MFSFLRIFSGLSPVARYETILYRGFCGWGGVVEVGVVISRFFADISIIALQMLS